MIDEQLPKELADELKNIERVISGKGDKKEAEALLANLNYKAEAFLEYIKLLKKNS